MSQMARYRGWQLLAIEKNMLNIEHIVSTIDDPAIFDKRDGGDGWTISEVLGHLADTDSYFLARARALATGEDPPGGSGRSVDERVKDAGYAEQSATDCCNGGWAPARIIMPLWHRCRKTTKSSGRARPAAASRSMTSWS